MKRGKYKVRVPRENVLTRDYWELLQVAPENRVEYTNRFFYKDVMVKVGDPWSKLEKYFKLLREGWQCYELVDFETPDDTIAYRMIKIISVAVSVKPCRNASVEVIPLFNSINPQSSETPGFKTGFPDKCKDHDLPESLVYEDWDIDSTLAGKGQPSLDDYNLVNELLKANDTRVRDRIKGKKIYDEYELLGKERCSVGAFSFITKHCTQAVYRDGVCYGHWMAAQDKRPGYNPAMPDESLHLTKRPYIASVDRRSIVIKMRQYHEVTKPVTPAIDTPKKPRCKHLLHKDECSICLGRPSVESESVDGLPVEADTFMVINY